MGPLRVEGQGCGNSREQGRSQPSWSRSPSLSLPTPSRTRPTRLSWPSPSNRSPARGTPRWAKSTSRRYRWERSPLSACFRRSRPIDGTAERGPGTGAQPPLGPGAAGRFRYAGDPRRLPMGRAIRTLARTLRSAAAPIATLHGSQPPELMGGSLAGLIPRTPRRELIAAPVDSYRPAGASGGGGGGDAVRWVTVLARTIATPTMPRPTTSTAMAGPCSWT